MKATVYQNPRYNEPCNRIKQFTIITILEIIHRPLFYLKHTVFETRFTLRLKMKSTQKGPIDRTSLCLRTNFIIRSNLKTETESGFLYIAI
jgi:hypothetical protein